MKVNGPGKWKLGQRRNSALTKHTWLYIYSDLLHAFMGKHTSALGNNRGDLNIPVSTVPSSKDTFKTKRNGKL